MTPPKLKPGPPSVLTPTQECELWAWYQAKKHLGTYKSKAKELGLSEHTLASALKNMRRRQREQDAKRRKFIRELQGCPF